MTNEHGEQPVLGRDALEPARKLAGNLGEAFAPRRDRERMARLQHLSHS